MAKSIKQAIIIFVLKLIIVTLNKLNFLQEIGQIELISLIWSNCRKMNLKSYKNSVIKLKIAVNFRLKNIIDKCEFLKISPFSKIFLSNYCVSIVFIRLIILWFSIFSIAISILFQKKVNILMIIYIYI